LSDRSHSDGTPRPNDRRDLAADPPEPNRPGRPGPRPRRGDPYAGVPGRRLFIGVPLPEDAAAAVASVVDEVRAKALPPGWKDVRWVRLDGLHLTLRFLGPTPEPRIEPTAAAVVDVASRASGPIELELGGVGAFPSGRRPRTIWIGLTGGVEPLGRLAAEVDRALKAAGWPPVDRPFRAHLTLARSDGLASGPLVAERLAEAMGERRIRSRLDGLGLFESVTGGGPARYVPVTLATLGSRPSSTASVYHQGSEDPL
jgi:2'-5' RNA ligase